MPHRGYSGFGKEKVYSQDDVARHDGDGDVGKQLRKISDYKVCLSGPRSISRRRSKIGQESYEIGSEYDDQQQNIWLPEDTLPEFRAYMNALYDKLADVGKVVLEAFAVGLGLNADERTALMDLDSERHSQLRLLHYPALSKEKLQSELLARLPAHTDWG